MFTIPVSIGAFIGIIYFWYAVIIRKKNSALESLSGIDVQLKKRYDLIPNILKIAQKFMTHEKELFTEISSIRTKALAINVKTSEIKNVKEKLNLEGILGGKLNQLMLAVENYPELKSDQNMLHAQQTLNEVEEHISAARRFYNSAVKSLNNAIMIFPGNIIAKIANAETMPYFEATEKEKKAIDVSEYLK